MSTFLPDMPVPVANADDRGFWAACAEQRLVFQACAACSRLRHPPIPICPSCRSSKLEWRAAPSEAEVYTFSVVHHAAHPAVAEKIPYVIAVVTFPEMPGVRLITNITHCEPRDVRIGMKVSLWWDRVNDLQSLPRFRPSVPA